MDRIDPNPDRAPWILAQVVIPVRRRWLPYFGGITREVRAARRMFPRAKGWTFKRFSGTEITIIAPSLDDLEDFTCEFLVSYDLAVITQAERDRQIDRIMRQARPYLGKIKPEYIRHDG